MDPKDAVLVQALTDRKTNLLSELNGISTELSTESLKNVTLARAQALTKRVDRLVEVFSKLEEEIFTINARVPSENKINVKDLKVFTDTISSVYERCAYVEMNRNPKPIATQPTTLKSASQSQDRDKLPRLSLPKFSGDVSQWQTFINSYNCLVHDKTYLSGTEKMNYLLSCLSGEAISKIQHLEISDQSYTTAYDLLKSRYANPRRLASFYLQKILTYGTSGKKDMVDFLTIHRSATNALSNLTEVTDLKDFLLFEISYMNLPVHLRKKFDLRHGNETIPTLKQFLDYVEIEAQSEEYQEGLKSVTFSKPLSTPKSTDKGSMASGFKERQSNHHKKALLAHQKSGNSKTVTCPHCSQQGHKIYSCPSFIQLPVAERETIIRGAYLCISCLNAHPGKQCTSTFSCRTCGDKGHNTLLHQPSVSSGVTISTKTEESAGGNKPGCYSCTSSRSFGLLGTIKCLIQDNWGNLHPVRVVIDPGSEISLITSSLVHKLRIKKQSAKFDIEGVNDGSSTSKGLVDVSLVSNYQPARPLQVSAFILSKICKALPTSDIPCTLPNHLTGFPLADPEFYKKTPVDLLLGSDVSCDIISDEPYAIIKGAPSGIKTSFGLILCGKTTGWIDQPQPKTLFIKAEQLDAVISRFWQAEEVDQTPILNPDEEECENFFKSTHSRTEDGKYVVRLPTKSNLSQLGNNRESAMKSLERLEKRLIRNKNLENQYSAFLNDYLDQNHMEPAQRPSNYILPHHCVLKESSTTKLMVVFDGSAPSDTGLSINSCLHAGPLLLKDVTQIHYVFRFYPVALTADIQQMFRNIWVDPRDRIYQHILWKTDKSKITEFELKTVTYDLSPSPCLAQRTLLQLAEDEGENYPEAVRAIKKNSFMDDFATGADSSEEARELQRQLSELLAKGGFNIRKWTSSDPSVIAHLPSEMKETLVTFPFGAEGVKILGLFWEQKTDSFCYQITPFKESKITKRTVLSYIARIYDIMGYLAPVIFKAKSFMQRLWLQKSLTWDDPLSTEDSSEWLNFTSELEVLSKLRIPRLINTTNGVVRIVGFGDASEKGMAAVAYLHIAYPNQTSQVHLVRAKTKVAPIKTQTVPHLELSACLLLSKLISCVRSQTDVPVEAVHLYNDSTIVLTWLRTSPHLLKTYEANRVVKINDLTKDCIWSHVPSAENAADFPSRGGNAITFMETETWFRGPYFLHEPPETWHSTQPVCLLVTDDEEEQELKSDWISQFSSYTTLIRRTALCLRFINNCRNKIKFKSKTISTEELQQAVIRCVVLEQVPYKRDIMNLKEKKKVSKPLRKLNPSLDSAGVIRVGGRLGKSDLPESAKHPLLLPKRSHFATLIIEYYHRLLLHSGVRTTQAAIQRKFWIESAYSRIKNQLHKCLRCHKLSAKPKQPIMGELPRSRVTVSRPFASTAVDMAGPIITKETTRRKSPQHKSYLCSFVCMTTKAVHLELVSELSTKAFMACFQRFISRRNSPQDMYSDCGSNFRGAARELQEAVAFWIDSQNDIMTQSSHLNVRWHFAPAYSPNFNGLCEASIKSAKKLLIRQIGNDVLTFEELTTLLTRIEAVLNSRPLVPLSTDPSEGVDYLSPAHFLVGSTLILPPEIPLENINHLDRWHRVSKLSQQFWKVWTQQYLHTLIQLPKWNQSSKDLEEGQLVYIINLATHPLQWPLGRIIRVHPGEDGVVRVATVKTSTGTYRRATSKLLALPQED